MRILRSIPTHGTRSIASCRGRCPGTKFRTATSWAASRFDYYARREHAFLDWVDRHREIGLIHFQEYTPWLAPRHFRTLRSRQGLPIVFTVHNIKHHYKKFIMHSIMRDRQLPVGVADLRRAAASTPRVCARGGSRKFLAGNHPPIFVTPHGVWHEAHPTGETPQDGWGRRHRLLLLRGAPAEQGGPRPAPGTGPAPRLRPDDRR